MERMSKRFWLLGFVAIILIAFLLACGSTYNSGSNGLVLVGSQGSSVIQTFSLNPGSGHVASVSNSTNDTGNQTCILNGLPADILMHPSGQFAFAVMNPTPQCSNSITGIQVFKVNSNGTLSAQSSPQSLNQTSATVVLSVNECGTSVPVSFSVTAPVSPAKLATDTSGKFLFVAEQSTSTGSQTPQYTCNGTPTTTSVDVPVPGTIAVFSIGSDGTLAEVSGSPFAVPTSARTPNLVGAALTPTAFPATGINGVQNAVCSAAGNSPPTSVYLYAVDSDNYLVWQFSVDMSTGVLSAPLPATTPNSFTTDAIPAGIAVDPCDRFVYVSGNRNNKINAYTICTAITPGTCPSADGSLVAVSGSPFPVTGSASGLGPILVDPNGNDVYVLGTSSNTVSGFRISPVSGSLTALSPATVATGSSPKSMTIRSDNSWMFVTNYGSQSVSQYAITPATGVLTTAAPITTDNLPFGVAVK